MLITKTKPVGVDIPIQQAQTKLYDGLLKKFPSLNHTSYGRCYRNKSGNGYVAEVFTGDTDYKDVYLDDTVDMTSFFGIADKITDDVQNVTYVHLVVFVNLQKIFPAIVHRADEEARNAVVAAIGKTAYGLSLQSIEMGVDNALKEYPGTRRDDGLKIADMSPWHCFRLNYKLIYNPNRIC